MFCAKRQPRCSIMCWAESGAAWYAVVVLHTIPLSRLFKPLSGEMVRLTHYAPRASTFHLCAQRIRGSPGYSPGGSNRYNPVTMMGAAMYIAFFPKASFTP
jgi:hypothetical protein